MPARARLVEHLGDETFISAELKGGDQALVVVQGVAAVKPGERVGLTFDAADAHLFMASGDRVETSRPD
jgi:ABC-type sugar transport system ATPase subunit